MIKTEEIIVGSVAGIVAGAMMLATMQTGAVSSLNVTLFAAPAALAMLFVALAAIYIVSLGWSIMAGITATVIASLAIYVARSFPASLFCLILLFGPAAWVGHLTRKHRLSSVDKSTVWFPLDMIFLQLVAMIAIGFIALGVAFGYDIAAIANFMQRQLSPAARALFSDEQNQRIAEAYASIIPFLLPAMFVFLHVIVFYLSAIITRKTGRLARDRDDIPATANLPIVFAAIPIAGVAGMFFTDSPIYEISAVMAGAGLAAFTLTGLAEMHFMGRGRPWRMGALVAFYSIFILAMIIFTNALTTAIFFLLAILLVLAGLFRAAWRPRQFLPVTPADPPGV